jgi:hypothetical protein
MTEHTPKMQNIKSTDYRQFYQKTPPPSYNSSTKQQNAQQFTQPTPPSYNMFMKQQLTIPLPRSQQIAIPLPRSQQPLSKITPQRRDREDTEINM